MRALEFWKIVIMDPSNLLESLIALLDQQGIRYCVIGGQAVNAYAEPLVSLDLDLEVAVDQIEQVEKALTGEYQLKKFPHSINASLPGSDLRIQIQTDPRYGDFVTRSARREVLGLLLPVASLEDVLQGKIWAAQDPERRGSKRQKDLADIARLIEAYPELRSRVPEDLLSRLL